MAEGMWTAVRTTLGGLARGREVEAEGSRLRALAAVFFLSGAAGLIYELLWLRILALTFGVTSYAVSTVLAGFMAGLALGSVAAGRLADRAKNPLRVYAVLELLIGVTGALTPIAFAGLQELYRTAHPLLAASPAVLVLGRFFLAFGIMLIPTSLMGATLPVLLRSTLLRTGHVSSHLSLLYAVNTFGAIAGCLATPFFLIGTLGIRNSILVAAAVNLLAAVLALAMGGGATRQTTAGAGPTTDRLEHEESDSTLNAQRSTLLAQHPFPGRVRALAFWTIGLSGLLSLAYEVVWARLLALLFDGTVYSFALMLATYLLGLAAGSAAVKPLMRRPLPWPLLLAAVEALIGLASLFSLILLARFGWDAEPLFGWIPFLERLTGRGYLRYAAFVSFVAFFPATFLMGASFPIAAQIYTAGLPEVGRRVGTIYAINVCGSIFGSLLGGFVLLPALGVEASMKLLIGGNALLGLALLAGAPSVSPRARLGWGLASAALFPLALAGMPSLYGTLFGSRFTGERVIWREEGIENTVTVAERPERRVLLLNGHHQANDSPDMIRYHRLIGHLPMLLHPDPRRALVIGLGGGATPGAVTQHPGVEVDCVELSPSVARAAYFFAHVNHDVMRQPNLRLRVDDGRNHLLLTDRRYDVITADLILPHHAGAGNLYSLEYYQLCRRALAPGGIMGQWIGQSTPYQYQLMLRTFARAFPHVTLWSDGTLAIGSNEPLPLSRAAIARRFADARAGAALASVGLRHVEDLLSLYTSNRSEILAYVAEGPISSDDRPLIEYYRSSREMTGTDGVDEIHRDIRRAFRSRPAVRD